MLFRSKLAKEMGLGEEIVELVANHHRFLTPLEGEEHFEEGLPPAIKMSEEARVLVVASLFVST